MVLMLLFQNHTLRLSTTALDDITYQIFKMLFLNSRVKKKLAGVISETNSEIRLTVSHKTALIQTLRDNLISDQLDTNLGVPTTNLCSIIH